MFYFNIELHKDEIQAQSEPKLFRKSTLHIKRRESRKGNSSLSSSGVTSCEALTEGVTVDDEQQIKSAIARKLSSDGGSGASRSDSPEKDEDRQLKHRLQRQKAQSRKTFRFRKSRRGAGFLTNKDEEQHIEEIPLTSTNIISTSATKPSDEVALAEEESSSILDQSRDREDSSLSLLSPKKDGKNDSSESLNESSALLKNEDKVVTDSPTSLLMVFPYVDDDTNDDIEV